MSDELRFTQDHVWVRIDGNTAVIGISDFAQREMGDVTFVELPSVDTQVAKSDRLSIIESVKVASDVSTPVSGTVCDVNAELANAPELINTQPYGNGWLCALKDIDRGDVVDLMTEDEYMNFTA